MSERPKFFVLVPVLNEAGNMPRLSASLSALNREFSDRFDLRVILVDDGSVDETSELARQAAAESGFALEVLRHETNQGPGKAFSTGFSHLSSILSENDLVMTIEGDNTSRLELVRQMLTRMAEGYDTIFASPYMYGGQIVNTSAFRVFLSAVANLFVKESLGLHGLLTVSSFFRLYKAATLKHLQHCYGPAIVERAGFECMVEMAMKMVFCGISISEVPMVLDTQARVGKSRMKIMRTIRGYLTLWFHKRGWQQQAEMKR
jgi:dolichol-phosphate mannosyltransferase